MPARHRSAPRASCVCAERCVHGTIPGDGFRLRRVRFGAIIGHNWYEGCGGPRRAGRLYVSICNFQGLEVKLSGAFAGYFAVVLLIIANHTVLMPAEFQMWTVTGQVVDEN